MPPKKRRVVKQRQQREHPIVELWSTLASLSKLMAQSSKQLQQYKALLKQVAEITQHDTITASETLPDSVGQQSTWSTGFTFTETSPSEINRYVDYWLRTVELDMADALKNRDSAMKSLRETDVMDDDMLKNKAAVLTEAENILGTLNTVRHRWSRVVRFDTKSKKSLSAHTLKWLDRWLNQWNDTLNTFKKRLLHVKETYARIEQFNQ